MNETRNLCDDCYFCILDCPAELEDIKMGVGEYADNIISCRIYGCDDEEEDYL